MIYKNKLKLHFDTAANTYDKYAVIQKKIAKKTCSLIVDPVESTLELGSGTGFLSEELVKRPIRNLDCVDISKTMLDTLSKKQLTNNIKYIEKDIESFETDNKYDLIISSSTFQWLESPLKQLLRYHKLLKTNGQLIISFFIDGTFSELKESIVHVTRRPYYSGQNFLNSDEIETFLKEHQLHFHTEHQYLYHQTSSLKHFLKELKSIGANNAGYIGKIYKNEWQEIFRYYDKNYIRDNSPFIKYHVIYLKIIKR